MPDPDTAQNGSTVATPPANATDGNSNQPQPTQSQPANAAPVESGSAEANNGNSGPNDGGDGSDGDGGAGGRPGRAQRTINDLTAKYRDAERQLSEQNDLITRLTQGVDPDKVKLPDYAPGEEITNERIKKDVTTAASQIAAMTIAPAIKELADKIITRDGARSAVQEMREAIIRYPKLNEADADHYDSGLADRIEKSYQRFFEKDPSYGFMEHLELFGPELESTASTSSSSERSSTRSSRGTSINRGSGQGSRRSQKAPEDMSLDELESYIHTQNVG